MFSIPFTLLQPPPASQKMLNGMMEDNTFFSDPQPVRPRERRKLFNVRPLQRESLLPETRSPEARPKHQPPLQPPTFTFGESATRTPPLTSGVPRAGGEADWWRWSSSLGEFLGKMWSRDWLVCLGMDGLKVTNTKNPGKGR